MDRQWLSGIDVETALLIGVNHVETRKFLSLGVKTCGSWRDCVGLLPFFLRWPWGMKMEMRVLSPLPAGARIGGGPASVPASAGGWSAGGAAGTRHTTMSRALYQPLPAPAGSPASCWATGSAWKSSVRGKGRSWRIFLSSPIAFCSLHFINMIGFSLSSSFHWNKNEKNKSIFRVKTPAQKGNGFVGDLPT